MRMVTLKNQTIYQCEYCNKRFITKQGAKTHEEQYCFKSPIVRKKRIDEIDNCNHQFETVYSAMPGEPHLQQPDHDECIHCGVWESLWRQMKGAV